MVLASMSGHLALVLFLLAFNLQSTSGFDCVSTRRRVAVAAVSRPFLGDLDNLVRIGRQHNPALVVVSARHFWQLRESLFSPGKTYTAKILASSSGLGSRARAQFRGSTTRQKVWLVSPTCRNRLNGYGLLFRSSWPGWVKSEPARSKALVPHFIHVPVGEVRLHSAPSSSSPSQPGPLGWLP